MALKIDTFNHHLRKPVLFAADDDPLILMEGYIANWGRQDGEWVYTIKDTDGNKHENIRHCAILTDASMSDIVERMVWNMTTSDSIIILGNLVLACDFEPQNPKRFRKTWEKGVNAFLNENAEQSLLNQNPTLGPIRGVHAKVIEKLDRLTK